VSSWNSNYYHNTLLNSPVGTDQLLQGCLGNGALGLNWLLTSTHTGCNLNRVRDPGGAEFISSVRTEILTDCAANLTAFTLLETNSLLFYILLMEVTI
jgi:hypothetical protein